MKSKNLISILGLALSFTGCRQDNTQNPNYVPQSISTEGKTPIEKLDRNTLVNGNGFSVDFNGDNITDLVSMRQNRVYFSDGRNKKEIEIAYVTIPVIAYGIRITQRELPYLVFFDQNDNGYKQENLGPNQNGIPILGDISLESK